MALIEALESGKVGAAGLDVIEDELGMYYYNRKSDILSKRDLYVLRGFPECDRHAAYGVLYRSAVSDMVKHSIESCILREAGKERPVGGLFKKKGDSDDLRERTCENF